MTMSDSKNNIPTDPIGFCRNNVSSPPLATSPLELYCKTSFVFEVRVKNRKEIWSTMAGDSGIKNRWRINKVTIDSIRWKQVQHSCESSNHVNNHQVSKKHPISRSYQEDIIRKVERRVRKLFLGGHIGRCCGSAANVVVMDVEIVRELKSLTTLAITVRSSDHDDHVGDDDDDDDNNELCAICLENVAVRTAFILPCRHKYHGECIDQWIRKKPDCPLCRDSLLSSPMPNP